MTFPSWGIDKCPLFQSKTLIPEANASNAKNNNQLKAQFLKVKKLSNGFVTATQESLMLVSTLTVIKYVSRYTACAWSVASI